MVMAGFDHKSLETERYEEVNEEVNLAVADGYEGVLGNPAAGTFLLTWTNLTVAFVSAIVLGLFESSAGFLD